MPRRAKATRREIPPDAKYSNVTVARFINRMMTRGKKSTAEKIVYGALQLIEQQESNPPVVVLEQAVRNATPLLEVKPRRVGGATYQVPVEVRTERALSLALRWLVQSARARTGRSMRMSESIQDECDYWYCHRCGLPVDFKEAENGGYVVDHQCQVDNHDHRVIDVNQERSDANGN